ncbi:histidine phosphatase family protein [Leifsonia flava]|uniref:Histidine phosphatase family protein n=1 Tax=Orlajensenia leifsoniae TaxID=2561933 RepID=A0A4Y9QZQ5_9MICO|nr:histidine phosphatase family protein [Leifsonia flava]TFV98034.1 histidine phosphatase family protein [Leifsonia flava]
MAASRIHLVRHGEVENPERVLYGRLEGYGLSVLGQRMAQAAADEIVASGRPVSALFASPLQRTQESAAPIALALDLTPRLDERFIEPANDFEGMRMTGPDGALRRPRNWVKLRNPLRPSWGEPFASIAARMMAGIADADASVDGGDVVIVSHQLPIWMVARTVAGQRLAHDPRRRRCELSSITSLEKRDGVYVEVAYSDPAGPLHAEATDVGAV